jgi:tryptophan-rich sensory protein
MTNDLARFVVAFAVCFAAAALGAAFPPDAWYAALSKPWFQPPNWLFGPVWTALYTMMAIALWRVWRLPPSPARRTALLLFAGQLALNAAWTPVFFGARAIGAALIVLLVLVAIVGVTIVRFWSLDRLASALLWPYLAWIGFASALNAALWWLNA